MRSSGVCGRSSQAGSADGFLGVGSTALFLPCAQDSITVKCQPEILAERREISASCSAPILAIEPIPLSCVELLHVARVTQGLFNFHCRDMISGLREVDFLSRLTPSKQHDQE